MDTLLNPEFVLISSINFLPLEPSQGSNPNETVSAFSGQTLTQFRHKIHSLEMYKPIPVPAKVPI